MMTLRCSSGWEWRLVLRLGLSLRRFVPPSPWCALAPTLAHLQTRWLSAQDYEKAAAFVPPSLHPYLKEMVTVTDS